MKILCLGNKSHKETVWQKAYPNLDLTDDEKKALYERHSAELANDTTQQLPLHIGISRSLTAVRLEDLPNGRMFMTKEGKICLKTGYRSATADMEAYEVGTGLIFGVFKYSNELNDLRVYPLTVEPIKLT